LHELTISQHSLLHAVRIFYRQREIREVCIHPRGRGNITPFKHYLLCYSGSSSRRPWGWGEGELKPENR